PHTDERSCPTRHSSDLDPQPGEEADTVTPIAYLTDAEAEPAQILEREENSRNRTDGLRHALAKLDDRSREIIEARWLREDDDQADRKSTRPNSSHQIIS